MRTNWPAECRIEKSRCPKLANDYRIAQAPANKGRALLIRKAGSKVAVAVSR